MNVAFEADQEKSAVVCPAVQHIFVEVNFPPHLDLRSRHFCDEFAQADQSPRRLVEL